MYTRMIILLCLLWATQGCTALMAANTPDPVDDEFIKLGMERSEVEELLDNYSNYDVEFEVGTLVQYRYEDHNAWTGRAAIYAPFALADVIFLPLELKIQQAGQRWASALYDLSDRLVHFVSLDHIGERVIELGGAPEPLVVARRHTYWDAAFGPRSTYGEGEQDEDF